jgi:hypothetical protein
MALLKGGLVNSKSSRKAELPVREASFDGAAHDAVDLVPAQAHLARDSGHVRLPKPVDDQAPEHGGKLRALLGPGDTNLSHPMGWAIDPRNFGNQDGLELARAQVAPPALARVIPSAVQAAFRTRRLSTVLKEDLDLLAGLLKLDVDHRPRIVNVEDTRIEVSISHPGRIARQALPPPHAPPPAGPSQRSGSGPTAVATLSAASTRASIEEERRAA